MANQDMELVLKLRAEMDSAVKEIKTLKKELDVLRKTSDKNAKSFKNNEAAYKKIGNSVSSLTKKLAALGTAFLSFQGAKELVSTTADLEKGFIEVAKTTGITGDALKTLEDDLFKLSTSMAGVSIEELQDVAATAGQLGIQGSKNILEFTRVISMMGTATDLSAQEAAEAMAGLGNSLGVPIEEFERLGSVIDKVSDNSTASAANLVEYAQRIAGMGKTFGLTADEVIAFGATLKDVGIKAELGGTAVSKLMMEMLQNTKGFADAAGMEFNTFSELIKNEPVKAIEVFLDSLSKLSKNQKIQVLDDLKLSSSGATQTVLKLSDGLDKLKGNLKTAGTEWKANTSLMKSYTTASGGFDAKMETFKNQVKELAYKIGESLLPALGDLVEDTGSWIQSLDKEKVDTFTQSIITLGKAIKNLGHAAKTAHDYTAPDSLFGEGAGIFSVMGDHVLALAHAFNEVTYDATELNDVIDAQREKFDGVFYAIGHMASTSTNIDALKKSISELVSENEKLIEQYNSSHSEKQHAAAAELVKVNKELKDSLNTLNTDPAYKNLAEDIDKAADASKKMAKEQSEVAKALNDEQIKDLRKFYQTREKEHKSSLHSLKSQEKKLAADILNINKKLATELKRIDEDRFQTNHDINQEIRELEISLLPEYKQFAAKEKMEAEALSNAKIALKKGELEKYKIYLSEYERLAIDSANRIATGEGSVAATEEQTTREKIRILKEKLALENDAYAKKEQMAKAEHDAAIARTKTEIELTKTRIELEIKAMEAMKQFYEQTSGKKIDIDMSDMYKLIDNIAGIEADLLQVGNTVTSVKTDNTALDATKQKIEEVRTLTLNGVTLEVDANTTPADFGIEKLITSVDEKTGVITIEMNPETEKAEREIEKALKPKPIKAPVDADTKKAEVKIKDLGKSAKTKAVVPVDADTASASKKVVSLKKDIASPSTHKVKIDASTAFSVINQLKLPTSSQHTIYVKKVYTNSEGGPIPQRLAVGGTFTGSGKVPGYDATDSDKVNAKLTGGEYVVKRRAVNKIGVPVLHAINQEAVSPAAANALIENHKVPKSFASPIRMPRDRGYAEGGLVAGAGQSVPVQSSLGDLGTLTLKVGNEEFEVYSPRKTAEALQIYIESEGGL